MESQSPYSEDISIPIDNLKETENLKAEFTCMICLSFVLRPLLLKCCDHLICTGCLKLYIRASESKPKCPLCKHSLSYSNPNRILQRIYSNLKLKCVNCDEIVNSDHYLLHLFNECKVENSVNQEKKFCSVCKEVTERKEIHKCISKKEIKELK